MKKLQPIFNNEQKPGIYRLGSRAKPDSIIEACQEENWHCFYINGREVKDKPTFLQNCGKAMSFPEYFGGNWDAFEECVNDLEWLEPANGYVLLYDHVVQFARKEPEEWKMAHNILAESVQRWQGTKTPLYILFRNTWWYVRGLEKL